ncbi:MAG: DNA primase DnaG [Candidatus Helarchaeota archaeon]
MGEELDLRELQKTGRIGRIQVNIESGSGKSVGQIIIPSSLNRIETSILASALETVDRVGPCIARIILKQIEDIRETKRRKIIQRAADILKHWEADVIPESQEISNRVLEEIKTGDILKYGPDRLPAGPEIENSDEILIVEGRADVLNLLRCGITNTIAVEGTNIPKSIADIAKGKKVTVFFDDDRGGDLILKEIKQLIKIDYIIKSIEGKSVEELTKREIFKCLKNKIPFTDRTEPKKEPPKPKKGKKEQKEKKKDKKQDSRKSSKAIAKIDKKLINRAMEIKETLSSTIFNNNLEPIENIGVLDLADRLNEIQQPIKAIVFDGVVTQRLLDIAEEKKVQAIICAKIGKITKRPINITIITFSQLNLN